MSEESSEPVMVDITKQFSFLTAGMLGVIVTQEMVENGDYVRDLRLRMIEARILRIEEAFKRTGFDINSIDLSNIPG